MMKMTTTIPFMSCFIVGICIFNFLQVGWKLSSEEWDDSSPFRIEVSNVNDSYQVSESSLYHTIVTIRPNSSPPSTENSNGKVSTKRKRTEDVRIENYEVSLSHLTQYQEVHTRDISLIHSPIVHHYFI